jgi:hypothetical protein
LKQGRINFESEIIKQTIMSTFFNQMESEQPFTTGWQHFGEDIVRSILHTLNHSLDFKSDASARELVIFLLFSIAVQFVLIPEEGYPTLLATISIYTFGILCDVLIVAIPMVALCVRLIRKRMNDSPSCMLGDMAG